MHRSGIMVVLLGIIILDIRNLPSYMADNLRKYPCGSLGRFCQADGSDVACVKVSIVDADGIVVPTAENRVRFEVTGAGTLLGLGNEDPGCPESDKASDRQAFSGLLLALIQAKEETGEIKIKAVSPGLEACELVLSTN